MANVDRVFAPDLWTILAALNGFDKRLGKAHVWAGDDYQTKLMAWMSSLKVDVPLVKGLIGVADFSVKAINDALEKGGFDRFFSIPFPENGMNIGMAGGLKYEGLYFHQGEPTHVARDNNRHDAVKLGLDMHRVEIYDYNGAPLVVVPLKTGERLLITPNEQQADQWGIYNSGFALAVAYNGGLKLAGGEYVDVVIPQVDIREQKTNIAFMKGLRTAGGWIITEAIQKLLFQLGTKGVKVEVKTEMVASRSMGHGSHTLVIDKPYLAVIVNPALASKAPIFIGRAAVADWKSPDREGRAAA